MDIVERLRAVSQGYVVLLNDHGVYTEAADEIERLQKENELLQKELKKHLTYQEHRHGRIGTHDPICYEYGPRHYECALREIERLREALKQYRDGHYSGYVTLPCGWDDEGTLASYALKGFDVATYVNDCEKAYAKLKEDE